MIGFFKGQPTDYVVKFVSGKERREGLGIAFYYLKHNTQIVTVPTSSQDAHFIFNESTGNFQAVTIQGQFTFRIEQPKKAMSLLNFTISPSTRNYLTKDPDKVQQRLTNIIQMETRQEIQKRSLEKALAESEAIAKTVLIKIREGKLLESIGVELMSVYFLNVAATPEVAKALEADYRETLLKKADEAIYARRASAVEQERTIKENELSNQIALEERRQQLIDLEGKNLHAEAETRGKITALEADYNAKALEKQLAPYKQMDPRILLAAGLKDLAGNADKIGNLNITSELFAEILNPARSSSAHGKN